MTTGGVNADHFAIASAELYDPATGSFAFIGDMSTERMEHTATRLPDGKALVAAGWYHDTADLYAVVSGNPSLRFLHEITWMSSLERRV